MAPAPTLPDLRSQVQARLSNFPNLDPRAVLAVGSQEGLSGGIGDGGHAFGFAQENDAGGVLTGRFPGQTPQQLQAWANSPQGIDDALGRMNQVAAGLKGADAINALVGKFERPADPKREIAGALQAYSGAIDAKAGTLQQLKDQYGTWGGAVAAMDPTTEPVDPKQSLAVSLFNAAIPSAKSVSLMAGLGGIAAKAAKASEAEIALPSVLVGQLKGPKGPIDVRMDHKELISPNMAPVVQEAEKYLGTPYLWGGVDPRKGFDCSGFVQYLYKKEGVNLPRTTYQQVKVGQPVNDPKNLQPGDVVFFSQKGDVHHEGLYIGHGQFIHAPHTGDVVKISSINDPYYKQQFIAGRRMMPAQTAGGAV